MYLVDTNVWLERLLCRKERHSIYKQVRAKLAFRNVAAGLPKNRPNCSGIEFLVPGYGERLLLACSRYTAEFYVGAPLGKKRNQTSGRC
jgi:hypothetical protein